MRLRSRLLLLCLALVLAAAGTVLLINGLRDRAPEATPTPSAPVSLSADDARDIPDADGRWTHQDNIVVRAAPEEPGE